MFGFHSHKLCLISARKTFIENQNHWKIEMVIIIMNGTLSILTLMEGGEWNT